VTDKGRLSQIFINLIGNALKFTSKGGITVSAQVYNKDKNYLQLSVLDTGIGIQEINVNFSRFSVKSSMKKTALL